MLELLLLCQTTWLCSAPATLHTGQSEPNMHLGNKKDATGCQFWLTVNFLLSVSQLLKSKKNSSFVGAWEIKFEAKISMSSQHL